MSTFIKYPKTYALDRELLPSDPISKLLGPNQKLIVEEKMDGTQLGLAFDAQGNPILQSRGTIISSEREFAAMKAWVWENHSALFKALDERYLMFGEWLFAKHTIFYDLLPHFFLEFDIYDRQEEHFLSTSARQEFMKLHKLDFVSSVRVIEQRAKSVSQLSELIGESAFISIEAYKKLSPDEREHTDDSNLMEGLYIKVESEEAVLSRYKLIRAEFLEKIIASGEHWKKRELVRNLLRNTD